MTEIKWNHMSYQQASPPYWVSLAANPALPSCLHLIIRLLPHPCLTWCPSKASSDLQLSNWSLLAVKRACYLLRVFSMQTTNPPPRISEYTGSQMPNAWYPLLPQGRMHHYSIAFPWFWLVILDGPLFHMLNLRTKLSSCSWSFQLAPGPSQTTSLLFPT